MRLLIVNPYASAVEDARLRAVERELAPVETALTEGRGHAAELARESGAETIFVFGGDGTFNEVLNGVAGDVAVGFVPGGGASVLPRALGIPRDPVRAARALADAQRRRITLGRVNGRRFAFSAGVGLDAEFVRRVDALGRRADGKRPGNLRFAWTALRTLAEHRVRLEPALEVVGLGRAAFALVANADVYTYFGRLPLRVAPEARFELGLDVVAPRELRPLALPRFVAYLLVTHGQTRAADVLYVHDADRAEIRCDRPLPLQADGEDLGDVTEVVVEAERAAVNVLVPFAS
jgi:diacylglycerol kinase family enzyme